MGILSDLAKGMAKKLCDEAYENWVKNGLPSISQVVRAVSGLEVGMSILGQEAGFIRDRVSVLEARVEALESEVMRLRKMVRG